MWMTLLKNKWVWGLIVVGGLSGYILWQELSYSKLELTLESTANSLVIKSQEVVELDNQLSQQKLEIERINKAKAVSEQVTQDVAIQFKLIKNQNLTLKQQIDSLAKEDDNVKEYGDRVVPPSIISRLLE